MIKSLFTILESQSTREQNQQTHQANTGEDRHPGQEIPTGTSRYNWTITYNKQLQILFDDGGLVYKMARSSSPRRPNSRFGG